MSSSTDPQSPMDGSMQPAASGQASSPPKPRRRRRRRLLIIAAAVLVVLLAGVGLGPTLLSTQTGTRIIVGMVNDRIRGHLDLDRLSLSWTGPTEVIGASILDPAGHEVVRVSKISSPCGVWGALMGWQDFEGLVVDKPEILVQVTPDGQITLAEAVSLRQASLPSSKTEPLPALRGKVTIRDGSVRILREQAGSYQVSGVSADLDLKTLNDTAGRVELGLQGGGKLTCDLKARDLFAGDRLNVSAATASLDLRTTPGVDLGPLTALLGPESAMSGSATLIVTGRVEKGVAQADLAAELMNLLGRREGTGQGEPVSANLKGDVRWADSKLVAHLTSTGKIGSAEAAVNYEPSPESAAPSIERIMAAVLAGESIKWPQFTLEAKAGLDVGALGRAFPRLLKIREDRQLTGGRLDVARLTLSTSTQPSVSAAIALTEVTALDGTKTVRLSPINMAGDAILETGKGVNFRQFTVESAFAELSASGTPAQFRAELKANLTMLQSELGQVFDFGDMKLAGDLSSTLHIAQGPADQMAVELQAGLSGLRWAQGNRSLELAKASLAHNGTMEMVKREPAKYSARTFTVNLNEEVLANGSGEYDLQQKKFSGAIELAKADLAFVSTRAAGLGVASLAGYSGGVHLQARMECAGEAGAITSNGQVTVKDLVRDGQPLLEGESRAEWSGLAIGPGDQGLRLEKAELQSVPAKLTAREVRWQSGEKATLQGTIAASADLAKCMVVAAKAGRWQDTPAISGHLQWDTNGTMSNQVATVTGRGQIQDFAVGKGAATRQQPVEFGYSLRLEPQPHRLTIEKLDLAGKPLTVSATGEIGQYDSDCVLSISGQYQASWPELTALLHELAPSTAATMSVTGISSSPFKITGAARRPGAAPSFREVKSGVEIKWDAADLYSVKMGQALLAPALAEGQITLPPATIAALQGKVNLAGMVDFQPADATIRIPGHLRLLENVAVTREMGDLLLSRINPIFAHVTSLQGKIDMDLNDILLPLGESMKTTGNGRGRLDLRDMRLGPGALMAQVLALSGLAQAADYPVEIGAVDLTLKNGRFHYDNFALTFPQQFDLRFRGSVGLDETLDLVVSLPVRPELLSKLKVVGPVTEYARLLAGSRVEIPLVGTREHPNLDFSRVDTQKLLKGVIEKSAGQPAQDLLKLLPGGAKPK